MNLMDYTIMNLVELIQDYIKEYHYIKECPKMDILFLKECYMNLKNFMKNKSTYMIVIFSLIIFTFSMCISIFSAKIRYSQELNGLPNGKSFHFNFESQKKVTFNNIVSIIRNYKNIYLEFDPVPIYLDNDTIFGKALYFDYTLNITPPIIEGTYLSKSDIDNNIPVVVIGNDLLPLTTENQGERFFQIDNKNFKVIGIIGYKDKKSAYDKQFIFNLTAIDSPGDSRANWKIVTHKDDNSAIINSLSADLNSKVIEKESVHKVDLREILFEMSDFINLLIIVFIIGIINILVLTLLWINGYYKEIGIRKTLGATNINISMNILGKYILIVLIASGFGTLLHFLCKNILDKAFPIVSFNLSILNILIITLFASSIGILTAIFPIIKSIKLPPAMTMKGSK